MSASGTSKASAPASPDATPSRGKGGFYLQSRTKVAILATCMVLMLGGSIYAVLQPLNAEPTRVTPSTRFWYPRETNLYARLPYVDCPNDGADDYACRLNSIDTHIGVCARRNFYGWSLGGHPCLGRPFGFLGRVDHRNQAPN